MNKDEPGPAGRQVEPPIAANDPALAKIQSRAEEAVLKIARLIGRQIAREEFGSRRIPRGQKGTGKSSE